LKLQFPNAYRLWMTLHGATPGKVFVPTAETPSIGEMASLELAVPEREPLTLMVNVTERRPAGRFGAGVMVELSDEQVVQCRALIGLGPATSTDARHVEGDGKNAVVIGDDDPLILSFLERALQRFGYDIYVVDNGQAAWSTIADVQPRLVLLDVLMPGLDGSEVCLRMRRTEALASTPVVLVSALNRDELRDIADSVGANDYLRKPIALADLLNAVGEYLKIGAAA
jgi:CheY-like chemotaxis protein